MRYAKHSSHSHHTATFAPTFHHRTGSSVATVKRALKSTHVAPQTQADLLSRGGIKVTEYPFNNWLDNPSNGYLILLAFLAALISLFLLK